MGLNNTQKVVLAIVVFIILLIGWGLFPLFFKWVMTGIGSTKVNIEDFGTMGDIYGSLNTLFTSATLIIVMYSAYLQRQANEDARTAMADQLREARNATTNQLNQARDALEQQLAQAREATERQIENAKELSKIELSQMQDATKQQLDLAQATHDAQMRESKHAIFSNMFNILLNQKNQAQERLSLRLGTTNLQSLFVHLSNKFEELVSDENEWKNFKISTESHQIIMAERCADEIEKFTGKTGVYDELVSYFYNYCSLITLIKKDEYKEFDTKFYFRILSNLMTQAEQETLLWICSTADYIKDAIEVSKLLDAHFFDGIIHFMFRNFKKSICNHSDILRDWDKYLKEQNPA
ncbi:hypothetical protein [Acinetobacter courvalinii]|uniref:Phage abortive infection protein n=1 Tax=Acinetobacter courvalinii TaxID=280147 RepID=N9RAW9_9GAMM|nr:hypothetical protein [Acinetobacter courvalinii]ENX35765.1 hypothetical protein F888_03598 [Acinetobacter courvalinii]KAB0655916.1 hypothetical protein F7P77_18140 [Acinetobacter courvalinii]RSN81259.1 hypothetical protein EA770_13200 [Acinetobacter baumannii]GGH39299.1 hypothetical protein GCM10007354_25020 [Acinetobacter courvalinii]